jgi:transcriptional regulator with XRE-family HTH domain
MTVNQAVRALRKHMGKTQQAFATATGISISALNNYERQRRPELKRLHVFHWFAQQAEREDLRKVFLKAIADKVGEPYVGPAMKLLLLDPHNTKTWFEFLAVEALALSLTEAAYRDLAPAVIRALAPVIQRRNQREEWEGPFAVIGREGFENEAIRRGYFAAINKEER